MAHGDGHERGALRMLFSGQFWRMALLWTASILFSRLLLLLLRLRAIASPTNTSSTSTSTSTITSQSPSPESQSRKTCVVTGATSGLGKAAALQLARRGYHLILAARNPELLAQTVQEIKELANHYQTVEAIQLDLSSYVSIKKFQLSLNKRLSHLGFHHSIQLLVNNAGILANSFRETPDGFDEMMATNYIGAFVLTNLLMPLLKNSPVPSRVVNTYVRYCTQGEKDKTTLVPLLMNIPNPPEIGVSSIIDASLAPPEASGKYFFGGKSRTIESSSLSGDIEIAEKLWSASSAIFKEMELKADHIISS